MQENLRLFFYTIVGLLIIWFIVMVIDAQVFSHYNADDIVFGTVPMNRTDIGDRCGTEYVNSNAIVDYKMNHQGQIIYLCPLGFSPIHQTVTAVTLPDAFRKSLTPAQQIKVVQYYPIIATPASPETNTTPVATQPTAIAPPAMSSTPPPVEDSSTTTSAPPVPSGG